ncbi:MAG: SDR family oxidoreductase [Pirellulaceae bacterium]|nr:SDR family oxidoreductase [Pirellulaceae bacterium]
MMVNKNYVIVGGSHGIGFGLVWRLFESGASVTVLSRTNENLESLPNVAYLQLDVTKDEIDASKLPSSIDGLAYCPGSINLGSIRQLKPQAMIDDYVLNVVGIVRCIQAVLPALQVPETSAIVLFSSVAVAQGLPMHASVAASKGAVEGLTRTLAAELSPSIRVNCIAPALTETRLASRFLSTPEKRKSMCELYPLKRVGTVEDVASLAEYLLSSTSSWMTGQVIGMDGGFSAVRK